MAVHSAQAEYAQAGAQAAAGAKALTARRRARAGRADLPGGQISAAGGTIDQLKARVGEVTRSARRWRGCSTART
jgi:hypothetical protein